MLAKAGPPSHVHDQGEEVFYILDGEMALQLGDQVVIGTSGQLVASRRARRTPSPSRPRPHGY